MEFKDIELKKLGVVNSKDRAMMMGSLASYKKESGATCECVCVCVCVCEEGWAGWIVWVWVW